MKVHSMALVGALLKLSMASASQSVVASCDASNFPVNMNNTECWGLTKANATTQDECIQACCALSGCQTWQWCPVGATGCPTPGTCWIGVVQGATCKTVQGWIGGAAQGPTPPGPAWQFTVNISSSQIPPINSMGVYGSPTNPATNETISIDSNSLRINKYPWIMTMGESQFARQPDVANWRSDLLAMKAGGIQVVATYIFWIHHAEANNVTWDWEGYRNLRQFVTIAGEIGLKVFLRIGPWAHGECRNGGFPDWVQHYPGIQLRSSQPLFLELTTQLYQEIMMQVQGLLWKDGGPVIGLQIENEYSGSYEYLQTLKSIVNASGFDLPIYTKTGWPTEAQPYGMLLPFFGQYPDGFWDRVLTPVPTYNDAFLFKEIQKGGIGDDAAGLVARASIDGRPSGATPAGHDASIQPTTEMHERRLQSSNGTDYPTLQVEIGGGMETSYHRRIHVDSDDMGAEAVVQLGSGTNCLGYYIYKGGTHPLGHWQSANQSFPSTEQESQITGYSNDLPPRSYDFYAPIGEFGQYRDHYHSMRMLHSFLGVQVWNSRLAMMPPFWPLYQPSSYADTTTLRWSARSDGTSGEIFVAQYQRNTNMSTVENAAFALLLSDGTNMTVPFATSPNITIPSGSYFHWPFNMEVKYTDESTGATIDTGISIAYALAQPVTQVVDHDDLVMVFAATQGIAPELVFYANNYTSIVNCGGSVCSQENGYIFIRNFTVGTSAAVTLASSLTNTQVTIVVLDRPTALQVYVGHINGINRAIIAGGAALLDPSTPSTLRIRTEEQGQISVAMVPAPTGQVTYNGQPLSGYQDGAFYRYSVPAPTPQVSVTYTQVQEAGPARTVPIGSAGVAQAPDQDGSTVDFAAAAIWNVTIKSLTGTGAPAPQYLPRIEINYTGDCARIYDNTGTFIADNFYNGRPVVLGTARYGPSFFDANGEATVQLYILPLSKDAPIYLQVPWPDFGTNSSIVQLNSIDVVQQYDAEFEVSG